MTKRKIFNTRGPVDSEHHYNVPRTAEVADLVNRIKEGRYSVIFAPRQTGKTTLFRWALDTVAEDETYFPIHLDFQTFKNASIEIFYQGFKSKVSTQVEYEFQRRNLAMGQGFQFFLKEYDLRDHYSLASFLKELAGHLDYRRIAIIIDEFDGIPKAALADFLYTLREIYHTRDILKRCPYSVGIVGVKSINQLNYDRSISPFNIQDDFALENFTLDQVTNLLAQYTEEVGQSFDPEVIEGVYRQTSGQPFLVNRLAQILTEELDIPLSEKITASHFEIAHQRILDERSTNIIHLTTNIRRDRRFESLLMRIALRERPVRFNLDNELISELATYGILAADEDRICKIQNPIYQYRIVQTFQPVINGLEDEFLPEGTDAEFHDYLTERDHIDLRRLLANFRDFIARAGYRILEIPDTPQEYVGQYLLFGYLDQFVLQIGGFMYLEVRTGRGRMDIIILYKQQRYIIETKLWEGKKSYGRGKQQLAMYLALEGEAEGYYVVFDHRRKPDAWQEEELIQDKTIVSFVIPVVQKRPSDQE